jgi:hypothetical protein
MGVRVLDRKAREHDHGDHGAHHSPLIGLVAAATVLLSFLVAAWAVVQAHGAPDLVVVETLFIWLPGGVAETAVHGVPAATPFTIEWA